MPNKTWIRIENSSFDRASYPFIKKVIYGILAGVFTGIAYSATLIMLGNTSNQTLGKFLGGIMYCTGILMCMFVGANLFPTNCFIYASILEKKVKRREYYLDLLITFISNWIGSIAIAGIVYGVGTLNDITKKVQEVAIAKVELE
ncbi:MAG: formate/nitrite transporter family protein [Mycoplasmoidaceae bacterium]|nr:formate/nitrite transporter family protein [Mycoplasmoidaceae bacterium]